MRSQHQGGFGAGFERPQRPEERLGTLSHGQQGTNGRFLPAQWSGGAVFRKKLSSRVQQGWPRRSEDGRAGGGCSRCPGEQGWQPSRWQGAGREGPMQRDDGLDVRPKGQQGVQAECRFPTGCREQGRGEASRGGVRWGARLVWAISGASQGRWGSERQACEVLPRATQSQCHLWV